MAVQGTEWVQQKFDQTLQEYARWTTRTMRQIIDTKAYYVARKAIWFTPKADAYQMKQQLGGFVWVNRLTKKGKTVKRRQVQLAQGTQINAPLAALIINARRGRAGEPGIYGAAMARAVRELLAARFRSAAFLKSGWLPSVKGLAPLADKQGAPPTDPQAKQVGRPKGTYRRYGSELRPMAEIVNLATTRRDTKGALMRYASDALRTALGDEERSMAEYIERKMRDGTVRANRGLA